RKVSEPGRSSARRPAQYQRTGGVCDRGEHDLEPGRGGDERMINETRRYFFSRAASGLGIAALANLLQADESLPGLPHFAPKAKRVIYLFQSGGPSQMELFDHKPRLKDLATTELPDSLPQGQRLTGMTST